MTKSEKNLIFDALRNAESHQLGIAEAYGFEGFVAQAALDNRKAYYALRSKLAKELNRDMKTELEKAIDEAELVDVRELRGLK